MTGTLEKRFGIAPFGVLHATEKKADALEFEVVHHERQGIDEARGHHFILKVRRMGDPKKYLKREDLTEVHWFKLMAAAEKYVGECISDLLGNPGMFRTAFNGPGVPQQPTNLIHVEVLRAGWEFSYRLSDPRETIVKASKKS